MAKGSNLGIYTTYSPPLTILLILSSHAAKESTALHTTLAMMAAPLPTPCSPPPCPHLPSQRSTLTSLPSFAAAHYCVRLLVLAIHCALIVILLLWLWLCEERLAIPYLSHGLSSCPLCITSRSAANSASSCLFPLPSCSPAGCHFLCRHLQHHCLLSSESSCRLRLMPRHCLSSAGTSASLVYRCLHFMFSSPISSCPPVPLPHILRRLCFLSACATASCCATTSCRAYPPH